MGVRPPTLATTADGPGCRGTTSFVRGGQGDPHPVRARAVALIYKVSARRRRIVPGVEWHSASLITLDIALRVLRINYRTSTPSFDASWAGPLHDSDLTGRSL